MPANQIPDNWNAAPVVLDAKEITEENNRSCKLISMKDKSGAPVEVAEALEINWNMSKKKIPIKELTGRTCYKVSFILMKKEEYIGRDQSVKLKLLLPNQEPIERTLDLSSIPTNKRTEIPVGDFVTPRYRRYGVVKISMAQADRKCMKKGLAVKKILMEPVKKNWKELSGENNWDGLLNPLNVDLSKFMVGYGERLDSFYDSIIDDANSPSYGHPMYKEKEFFPKAGPYKGKVTQIYEVKKHIYAWVKALAPHRSAWIGYVAVATDEGTRTLGRRDILICWRGTYNNTEWEKNASCLPTHAKVIYPTVPQAEVHRGFYSIYTEPNSEFDNKSARDQVIEEVENLVNLYKNEEMSITITGFSLGGTLATLNAADIVSNGYNKLGPNPQDKEFLVTAFVFGCPKVGDIVFQTEFNKHMLKRKLRLLRIENVNDSVTTIPHGSYVNVGNEIIFARTSASAIEFGKTKIDHNLKTYIRELCELPDLSPEATLESLRKKLPLTRRKVVSMVVSSFVTSLWAHVCGYINFCF